MSSAFEPVGERSVGVAGALDPEASVRRMSGRLLTARIRRPNGFASRATSRPMPP